MKNSIIITGAYGQDGLILSKILKKKFNIIGLVKRLDKNRGIDNIKYISLNLDKKKEIKKLIKRKKIKTIVHFACNNEPYVNKSKLDFFNYYEKNYKMTKNLIEAIIETDKKIQFLFAGTCQMLKSNDKNIVNINSKYVKSNSYYIKYKIDSEKLLFRLKKKFSLNITSMILFNHDSLYRPGNFLIKRIINYAKKKNINELKKIYRLNIKGDFSHAEDINNAIYLLLKKNNLNLDRIILSSNKLTKINNLIIYILKRLKFKETFKNVKVISNYNYKIGNNKLAKKLLKWKPKKNLINIISNIKY